MLVFLALLVNAPVLAVDLDHLTLPADFKIEIFAEDVNDARSLALGSTGVVYVGNRSGDKVYALQDANGDGRADRKKVLLKGLDMPNGIAVLGNDLFIAEKDRIVRYSNMDQHPFKVVDSTEITELPIEDHHGWRYLAVDPDGLLYVSIGAPCNICNEPGFARIERMAADGSGREVFAEGIRNSVGMDWDPQSSELWFTDNGRDWLGDDKPADEINHAPVKGLNFGYPWCHGGSLPDPKYGKEQSCKSFQEPAQLLQAHVAPLGIHFYTGQQFPEQYRQGAFVVEHGSWNRSTPVGYRVMFLQLHEGRVVDYQPFVSGWLDKSGGVHGRPVDVLTMPDGALLVSDDRTDVVYRISYSKRKDE